MTVAPRILFLCTQMEAGGVQVRSTSMMSALRKEGVEASVTFLYRKRPVFDGVEGVTVLFPRKPTNPVHYVKILIRLLWHVKKMRPTAIVGMAHYASPLACIAGLCFSVPKRIATQTNPPKSYSIVGRWLDWICGCTGIYSANIAASKTVEDCFAGYPEGYKEKLKTIMNGVSVMPVAIAKGEARRQFDLDENAFLIVSCGRLSKQKNQAFLLPIIAAIPDVRLAILGDGELRDEIQSEINRLGLQSRIKLLGEVPPQRVAVFLRCGDVFAFPSEFEAFGLAAAEAMLAGLPVIASNHPAMIEVIGDAGILLPLERELWVNKLHEMLGNKEMRLELAQRSLSRGASLTFEAMLASFKCELMN